MVARIVIITVILYPWPVEAAHHVRVACVGYMDADARYAEAMETAQPRSWVESLAWKVISLPQHIQDIRETAERERWHAYQKAYRGPRSEVRSVMAELISNDQLQCLMEKWGSDEEDCWTDDEDYWVDEGESGDWGR